MVHPIMQADSVYVLIGPVRVRPPPTLSWERVAGRSPDGCGAARRTDLVPPLFRRCGGTFPQGKVRKRLPAGEDDWVSAVVPISPARKVPGGCGHPPLRGWKDAKTPCALRHRGETILSSRNPGSFLHGWGGAASGWPCFRSGGSALSSRRRSGPPLPGCGSGRRTYRSASAVRRLPAR